MKTLNLRCIAVLMAALLLPAAARAQQVDKKDNPNEVRETLAGNVVADAMRAAMHTDVALVNAGSLGAADPGDDITEKNLPDIVPFPGDVVVAIRITGADLRTALEKSVSALPRRSSGFLQVSGVAFTADPNAKNGARISNIRINGAALKPDATYTVALTDFLSSGGSGFVSFKNGKLLDDAREQTLGDIVLEHAAITDAARKAVGSRISILPLKTK